MLIYPKIEYNNGIIGKKMIAFDKLDGSNLRFEWNRKRGFYKFGTRMTLISESDTNFGDAIPVFLDKYNEDLSRIFIDKYKRVQSIVVFAEYLGENSFAGSHKKEDKKNIILFDVALHNRGFISPYNFVDTFGHLDIPDIIYDGKFTYDFIDDVKNNIYDLHEGVVCKGQDWITKIKTTEWLEKVRIMYGEREYLNQFK